MSPYLPPAPAWDEEPVELVDVPHDDLVIGAEAGSWCVLLTSDDDAND